MGDPTRLETIPFHGATLGAVRADGGFRVSIRSVCDAIGIDFNAQYQRLKRTAWATMCMTHTVAEDGKTREMATIDRRTFTMWLATIDTRRIKNDTAKKRIITYQLEAAEALDNYFNTGIAISPRATEDQIDAGIDRARRQAEALRALEGILHPDHMRAHTSVLAARIMGTAPELDPATRPLYTQDYLREKGLSGARMRAVAGLFGKRVKAAYVDRDDKAPEQYPLNLSNGQVRMVNAYTEADRPLLDKVWNEHYAGVAA